MLLQRQQARLRLLSPLLARQRPQLPRLQAQNKRKRAWQPLLQLRGSGCLRLRWLAAAATLPLAGCI